MSCSRSCSSSVKRSRSTPLLQQKGACSWSALLFGGLRNALISMYCVSCCIFHLPYRGDGQYSEAHKTWLQIICVLSMPMFYVFMYYLCPCTLCYKGDGNQPLSDTHN